MEGKLVLKSYKDLLQFISSFKHYKTSLENSKYRRTTSSPLKSIRIGLIHCKMYAEILE